MNIILLVIVFLCAHSAQWFVPLLGGPAWSPPLYHSILSFLHGIEGHRAISSSLQLNACWLVFIGRRCRGKWHVTYFLQMACERVHFTIKKNYLLAILSLSMGLRVIGQCHPLLQLKKCNDWGFWGAVGSTHYNLWYAGGLLNGALCK